MFAWMESLLEKAYGYALSWANNVLFQALSSFFTNMGNMGAEIFDLSWVSALVQLFTYFGVCLFVIGTCVAVFDLAIEYQNGRSSIKGMAMNVIKGAMAAGLIFMLPVELYRFCVSLQSTALSDLLRLFGQYTADSIQSFSDVALNVLSHYMPLVSPLEYLLYLIALGYCVVKVFFANIKRGGILLVQIAVGSLYLFSVPRGYADGFTQWCKQVIALCLTAFLQTMLLYLGLMTWQTNLLLGLGIMVAANDVPRIAQQFGLDSSVRVNMMSIAHTTTTALNLTRSVVRAR